MRVNRTSIAQVNRAIETNEFIYWLRRIPIIKLFVSHTTYFTPRYKRWYRAIKTGGEWLNTLLWALLRMALFLFAANGLVDGFLSNITFMRFEDSAQSYVMILLLLCIVMSQRKLVFEDSSFKWLILDQFRADPLDYYHYALKTYGIHQLFVGLIYAIPLLLIGGALWFIPVLLLPLISFCTQEGLVLVYYLRKQIKLKWWMSFLKFILTVALYAGLLVFVDKNLIIVGHVLFFVLGSIVFIFALRQMTSTHVMVLNRYMKQTLKLSNEKNRELLELQTAAARIDENVDVSEGQKYIDKMTGFSMINRIFYVRHKRIWLKPLLLSLKVLGTAGVLLILAVILGLIFYNEDTLSFGHEAFANPLVLSKGFLFVMAMSNFTESIARAFFMNCDSALLHYAFYRRKKIIWQQYISRLTNLVLLNMVPTLIMLTVLVVLGVLGFIPMNGYFYSLMINVVLFSIFITNYNLVMYYIIQPYNLDMELKSPLYKVLNGLFFILVYQIPGDAFIALGEVNYLLVLSLALFILLSCCAVYLFGDKTFRLRKGVS